MNIKKRAVATAFSHRDLHIRRAKEGYIFFEVTRVDSISKVFRRAVIRVLNADPTIRFHSCRHTFAVNYLRNGGRLHILQSILGHSSILTTRKIYGKDTKESITQGINEFAKI